VSNPPPVKRPFLASAGRGCALRIAIVIVGPALGTCLLAVLLIVINAASNGDALSGLILLAILGLMNLFFVALIGGAIAVVVRRGRKWDETFAPLGLPGSMFALTGRQYKGSYGGREVKVQLMRGPTVLIQMVGAPGAKMAVTTRTGLGMAIRGAVGLTEVEMTDPAFERLIVSAREESWARGLLQDAPTREAVLAIMQDEAASEIRSLQFADDKLWLQIRRMPFSLLTTDKVRGWLDAMGAVLDTAERLPPPAADDGGV
jgi:hypothetical protein